jgi:hypothetical protein
LTGFEIAPVAVAYGNEADVLDLLSASHIRTSATWCYRKPGPERCVATLRIKDGSLILDGVGCGSFRVPVNGSNGRQTARITGNTITVSISGNNGIGVNTYELSTDLTQCSHTVECPAGYQAKVLSCSVERDTPTQANVRPGSSGKAGTKKGEPSPLAPAAGPPPSKDAIRDADARPSRSCSDITGVVDSVSSDCPSPDRVQNAPAPRVDAQSYLEAAKDLKELEPDYYSLSAAAYTFRRAAAAFQAAGEIARAQAATAEAQRLENGIKLPDQRDAQNQCGLLRGNALQCYNRATRSQSSSRPTPTSAGQTGAFLDCVKTYCRAMQTASCPMPLFGKDNAAFCLTTATDEADRFRQSSTACDPGKHLVLPPGGGEPVCQDDVDRSPEPKRTINRR